MKVHSIHIENIATIKKADVDYASLGDGIIAISGKTGHGKTHLLESTIPGLLFLRYPFYNNSTIADRWSGGGGKLSGIVEYRDIIYRIDITGKSQKTPDAILWQKSGDTWLPLSSSKVRDFQNVVAEIFPPKEIFLSSLYAAQCDVQGLFALDKAARADVFSKLINVVAYDKLIDTCSNDLKTLKSKISVIGNESVPDLKLRREEFSKQAGIIQDTLFGLLSEIRRTSELKCKIELELSNILKDKQVLAEDIREYKAQQTDLKHQIDNRYFAKSVFSFINSDNPTLEAGLLDDRLADVRRQADAICDTIEHIPVPNRRDIDSCEAALESIDWEYRRHTEDINSGLAIIDRLLGSADCLEGVNLAHPMCSACPLTASAREDASEMDRALERLLASVAGKQEQIEGALELSDAMSEAEAEYEATLARYNSDVSGLRASLKALEDEEVKILIRAKELENAINTSRIYGTPEALSAEISALVEQDDELGLKIKELESRLSILVVKSQKLHKELPKNLTELEAQADKHRQELLELDRQVNELTAKIEVYDSIYDENILIDVSDLATIVEVAKDARTARIESLSPSIEETCNLLLSEYAGGRFQVRIDTMTPRARVGGMKKDFAPTIIDNQTGREGMEVSGGERIMVAEALRMAIAVSASRSLGIVGATLGRDESISNLDNDVTWDYIRLLRMAKEMGKFSQILFISHHEHVWQQADRIIWVENGEVNVQ